jgi:hypothetical protein
VKESHSPAAGGNSDMLMLFQITSGTHEPRVALSQGLRLAFRGTWVPDSVENRFATSFLGTGHRLTLKLRFNYFPKDLGTVPQEQ